MSNTEFGYMGKLPSQSGSQNSGVFSITEQQYLKDRADWSGGIVTDSLNLWYDAGDTASYSGSGSTVTDLSGNGRNGTLYNGVGYSSTDGGGTFTFDGSNDYISATTGASAGDWEHSINFWFKMNQAQSAMSARQNPIQIGNVNTTSQYSAYDISSSNINWYFYSNDTRYTASNLFASSTWYNVCLTYAGGGGTSTNKKMYINNTNYGFNTSGSGNLNIASNATINIGRDGPRNTAYLNGKIALVQIYSKNLSASEVDQNYNYYKARFGY